MPAAVWADPDVIGCMDHPDSDYWSHVLLTVKLQLIFLEKQIQLKFRRKSVNLLVWESGLIMFVQLDKAEVTTLLQTGCLSTGFKGSLTTLWIRRP